MLLGTSWRRLTLATLVAASTVSFGVMPTRAQQLGNSKDTEDPAKSKKFSARFNQLKSGGDTPRPDDKELLSSAAEFYIYRVTWPVIQQMEWKTGMNAVQKNFQELMESAADFKNADFMKALAPKLIDCFQNVLKQADDLKSTVKQGTEYKVRYTAVTNAALMLPTLAKCRQESVDDFLIKRAKADANGKPIGHPFIRMCAIKGLGEMTKLGGTFAGPGKKTDQARELARAEVIKEFIAQPYEPEGNDPEHENAFAYVRREGVKALAQTQTPAFGNKDSKMIGPVAYYLLLIANGEKAPTGPAFTLSEKLEAALGVCNLKPAQTKEYNAELALFVVANMLVEFAEEYQKDFTRVLGLKKANPDTPPLPLLPWRTYAQRLDVGLEAMSSTALKDSPMKKKIEGFRGKVKLMLTRVQGGQPPPAGDLEVEVKTLRPASAEVFLGLNEYTLSLGKGD